MIVKITNYFQHLIILKNRIKSSKISLSSENRKLNFNSTYNTSKKINIETKTIYSHKKYKYIIRPENCGYLIKKCFNHRINWVELLDINQNDFNFKW